MQSSLIRARQIKALYQRELTALNRNPLLKDDERKAHAEALWRQACGQLDRLRASPGVNVATLTAEERAVFDPPKRPTYLDPVE